MFLSFGCKASVAIWLRVARALRFLIDAAIGEASLGRRLVTNFVDDFLCGVQSWVPEGALRFAVLSMLESIGCVTGKHQSGVSIVFIGVDVGRSFK